MSVRETKCYHFGLSGLILLFGSLFLKKTKQKIFHIPLLLTQEDAPISLHPALLSTCSLIISEVNVLSFYTMFQSALQNTTSEKLTEMTVPLVSAFFTLLFLLLLSISPCLVPSILEVNVLSCYTVCRSSSQTVTLEE